MKNIELIKAPSILGLRPTGVELLPESLIKAGLLERLNIKNTKEIPSLSYSYERDPETLVLNSQAIAQYSVMLADAVQETIQKGNFPLVLGGDCSIMLGNMLALKRMGRYGLFFLDGHADFYQPETSETGEAADMDLALVSGRGPELITNIEKQKPLVKDEDIVLFGQRDREETVKYGSQQVSETQINVFELGTIRKNGVEQSCKTAINALLAQPIEGFWVHIDADVIDDREMPAVDYRMPGGITFDELRSILEIIFATDKAVGLNLTIYNPKLDPKGKIATRLTGLLTDIS